MARQPQVSRLSVCLRPLCRVALSTAAFVGVGAVRPAVGTEPVQVFILAGQSNAVGHNTAASFAPAPFPDSLRSQPDVMFWPGSNANAAVRNTWTTLRVGVSSVGRDAFGPELAFGRHLQSKVPGARFAILKYAVGGTGIARSSDYDDYIPALAGFDDRGNNWHPPEPGRPAGALYTQLVTNVKAALAALEHDGHDHELRGFLWMQGEHEAGISRRMAADYGRLLVGFRDRVRVDLDAPRLPFLIGQISDKWIFRQDVQAAQERACVDDPRSRLVVTRDFTRTPGDDAHYDANGMVLLGTRFAEAALTFASEKPAREPTTAVPGRHVEQPPR